MQPKPEPKKEPDKESEELKPVEAEEKPQLKKSHKKFIFIGLAVGIALLVVLLAIATIYYVRSGFGKNAIENGPVAVKQEAPSPTTVPYVIEPVTTGLNVPWAIAFTSPTRMLVTERPGRVLVVENGVASAQPLITFPEVSNQSEEGLMGITADPNYSANKQVYACLAYKKGSGIADKVVRFKDNGTTSSELTTIIDNIPAAQFHAGCRVKFGPDGKLYITAGDATQKAIAQDLNSLGGKILRINSDGTVPADNPFGSPVWSYGDRNPQGIAWQPGTNSLFETEHGPSGSDGPGGGDEVNKIVKGGNYGWPLVSHDGKRDGTIAPLLVFTPAIAPSGAAFYSSDKLPQFTGNFFFTGLVGEGLFRVVFTKDNPDQITSYEKMADINLGRLREVVEGPDGNLYFTTSNRDGRGTVQPGDDKIYRIRPQ